MLVILLIFSLGPHLWLGTNYTAVQLPWTMLMRLPLLGGALPVRFALFVAFFIAPIVCLWISAAADMWNRRLRFAVGLLACLVIFPALRPQIAQPTAKFFAPGRVNQVLGPTPQLLILPYAITGPSSFWQVESGFAFTQTGGYLGFPPRAMQHFQAIWDMYNHDYGGNFLTDLTAFCTDTDTRYVVAGPGTPNDLLAVLNQLHWVSRQVDDVIIFTVPDVESLHG
jgi:hypothetical protein